MKAKHVVLQCSIVLFLCCACSSTSYPSEYPDTPPATIEELHLPQAQGTTQFSDGEYVSVDTSNCNDGYIMAKTLQASDQKIKLMIEKDGKKYSYDLSESQYLAFPLQMGNGTYEIRILRQVKNEEYARLAVKQIDVNLQDELSPYRYPSQIVNYDAFSNAVALAFDLVKDDQNDLQRIAHLYEYVVHNITYDDAKALAVANQFVLPYPDETLQSKTGICFDYAALLATMLRSQNIPTRLVTGYTDIEYHAWVEVYLENEGWINPKVYFDKASWSLMDPTFAASDMDYEGAYEQVYIY